MKFIKPSEYDLQDLLEEATKSQSVGEMIEAVTSGLADILKRNPAYYRAFGPWWWQVKAAMIRAGHSVFEDDSVDAEWIEHTAYDEPVYALIAAWNYMESQFDRGAQAANTHIIETDDGMTEYVLVDNELELMAGC